MLLLAPELGTIGGIQRRDRTLIRAMDTCLARRGDSLLVLALNDGPALAAHAELQRLHATQIEPFGGHRRRFVLAAARHFRGASAVFYGHLGFAPLALFQRVLAGRAQRVLLIHGREAWQRRGRLHALGAATMTAVVSISRCTLERFYQAYAFRNPPVGMILPNSLGPDHDVQALAGRQPEPGDGPPRLLTVARLAPEVQYKGVDTVIRALPQLLVRCPDLGYVVIGDGSDRSRLQSLARHLGVAGAVRFEGFVSEEALQRAYASCSVYVMPSAGEGFGIAFLEAMAHGRPVVAARAGGVPELVQHGINGFLVDHGDVAQLTATLWRLLDDPGLNRRIGESGARTVETGHTFGVYTGQVDRLLSQLVPVQACP
ncbi:MAG TPA: glycosyltransferase family 4 protein [Anaerolineae bacterium]|nr:glycosyltransferase family 4 protein [Anaerolineae bacterium]